jgi:hypothetical protein
MSGYQLDVGWDVVVAVAVNRDDFDPKMTGKAGFIADGDCADMA